jgi:hypothetical protein
VVAESALAVLLLAFLGRASRESLPSGRFLWRPLVALAAGALTLLVPLPDWIDGLAAAVVFTAVAFAVGAVPKEVVLALRRRAPGDVR